MSGRVLLGRARDTVPLANAMVVIHHVTRENAGPVDSMRSDARGRYRIELRNPDSSGAYVVSVWYDSLAYVSAPVMGGGRPLVHVDDIIAFATTVDVPPIYLARRLATVARPSDAGTREVLEILELENRGGTTRVTRDTLRPTWAGRVPQRTGQFRGGEGDISAEAMRFRNDSVLVFAPIAPGRPKQLSYAYSVAAGTRTFVLPIDQPTAAVNLLVEDTTATVRAPHLESRGTQAIEERHFAAYSAGPLVPGDRIEIELPAGKFHPQQLLPYVIAVLAAAMLVALVWALRRRPASPRLSA
ncbi:MAG TPA: hypothetical protein VNJ06_08075 [Gemmatimonadales bacterium]|nr:hypothetical protein [Gemmatimonadales bacterium]